MVVILFKARDPICDIWILKYTNRFTSCRCRRSISKKYRDRRTSYKPFLFIMGVSTDGGVIPGVEKKKKLDIPHEG